MANQFTSGGGSKGPKKNHDQATRDKIRAELLAKRMYNFAKAKGQKADKLAMSQAQVAAARVLIDKGKPSLQAIEQTNLNPLDAMSPEEIGEQVKALITSRLELLYAVLDADPGLRAAVLAHITGQPVAVQQQIGVQSTAA